MCSSDLATAVGTDLFYASATKTGGTLAHGVNRTIDWRLVALLAAGSVPMTVITLFAISQFDLKSAAAQSLTNMLLGGVLLLSALAIALRQRVLEIYAQWVERLSPHRISMLTIALGGVLGVLVSLTSVGAGALGVTALLLLYPRMPTVRIVGSDIAHAVPLTLIAGVGHWFLGTIDWALLGSLLIGSLPGIFVGSNISVRVPETVLRLTLAGMLVILGTRMLV